MVPKARKVLTPGSKPPKDKVKKRRKSGAGRPAKKVSRPFAPRRVGYTEADMAEAVRLVKEEGYCIKAAALETNRAKKNCVPRMTLSDRMKQPDPLKNQPLGRRQELSAVVENTLVDCLVKCGEFNYPMTKSDLQDIVQAYVTEHDIPTRWPNGRPAREWCRHFLKRHRATVKIRRPSNIRRSRGKVSPEIVKKYFEQLAISVHDIPPTHIFNYDETNLKDDPGSEAAFFASRTKYCEKIQDSSKVAFSLMFCVSAAGEMLPPMTVYKSATSTIYTRWSEGGPPGSVFAASASGWFDISKFNTWFDKVLIPHVSKLPRNG